MSLGSDYLRSLLEEDPERDREYSTGKGLSRQGVVDFRPIIK